MSSYTHHLLSCARNGRGRCASHGEVICHRLVTWLIENTDDLGRIDYSALHGFAELVELAGNGPQAFAADLREHGFKLREDAE